MITWTSRTKGKVPVCKMTHEHVLNTLLLLERTGSKHWVRKSKIYKALVRRLKKFEGKTIVKHTKWRRRIL